MLQIRAQKLQAVRNFFIEKNYLELDTPALSPDLIPETCLEVFKTDYVEPWENKIRPLYLVPSPEIYIKKILAQHPVNVFQLSKCYRNVESVGRIHNPEFTMLEYYTMNADYKDSIAITEDLFKKLIPPVPENGHDAFRTLRPPFMQLTMDEAFEKYAGFRLSECQEIKELAQQALNAGIAEPVDAPFHTWQWDDLYELIFVQCVEQQLPCDKPVLLTDYPEQSACLAKDKPEKNGGQPRWKQRWELYCGGIEIANCYTEETQSEKIKAYFESESGLKKKHARIPHAVDKNYWQLFRKFPDCSGVALGFDRLLMALTGRTEISSVLPFVW